MGPDDGCNKTLNLVVYSIVKFNELEPDSAVADLNASVLFPGPIFCENRLLLKLLQLASCPPRLLLGGDN